jgi:hypothetical protein
MDHTAIESESGQTIRQAAIIEAFDWYQQALARGMTPLNVITTAAMLVGQIIGCEAKDEAHAQYGVDQVSGMMRLAANDWIASRPAKH